MQDFPVSGVLWLKMKKLIHIIITFLAVCSGCSKGYADMAPSSDFYELSPSAQEKTLLATLKKDASGSVYLWSKGTRINLLGKIEFVRQQRVIAHLSVYATGGDEFEAYAHWMEPIDEGVLTSDVSAQGEDPVSVNLSSWMTGVDDAYLTINYSTWWGEHPVHHDFCLVAGLDPDDPYSLELRHNANGDGQAEYAEGVICFDLNALPDTGDTPKELTINWKDTGGKTAVAKFEFTSRK